MDSTIIHELNHSPWMNSTSEMVEVLNGISAGGGGDYPETVIDGLGYLVDGETIPWSSDSYKFAVVLTDAGYKVANRHGFNSLQEVADGRIWKLSVPLVVIIGSSILDFFNAGWRQLCDTLK